MGRNYFTLNLLTYYPTSGMVERFLLFPFTVPSLFGEVNKSRNILITLRRHEANPHVQPK